jgi:hypothetical protein
MSIEFDKINEIVKFDFSGFYELEKQTFVMINKDWMKKQYDLFLDIAFNNVYTNEKKQLKFIRLDETFKKFDYSKDLKSVEKVIHATVYNIAKYGTLKFGPIILIDPTGRIPLYLDLSKYTEEGMKNVLASVFAEQISLLLHSDFQSNFLNFCAARRIKPKKETKRFFFPRSFVLLEGNERAILRRELQVLFNYLVNDNAKLPDLQLLQYEVLA